MPLITNTDLDVFPLCLGGNVFGWSADRDESFAVLDAYTAGGGNFVDTADAYSAWAAGHSGGESETVIGEWMAARGSRDRMVIATKVGKLPGRKRLTRENVRACAIDSLRRLQTDRIDLYYAHEDDAETPLAETVAAFDAVVREGLVRHVAASNYTAPRLAEALDIAAREGLTPYAALQPHYNLIVRDEYEGDLRDACERHGVGCIPYFALASGFLTGKYRPGGPPVDSVRGARRYLEDPRALRVLGVLDGIAAERGATVSAVALAWLRVQPTVVAPIASARTAEQVAPLLESVTLELTPDELERLAAISA